MNGIALFIGDKRVGDAKAMKQHDRRIIATVGTW